MKKQFIYFILLLAFCSCTDEVKFNSPAFEGRKDNVFWRAVDAKATIAANGSLTIDAFTRNEKLTLKTSSVNLGDYVLGTDNSNSATYTLTDVGNSVTFSTGVAIGNGEIVIQEYDAINKTITGTFKFNALNTSNNPLFAPSLNFQFGNFLKVPVSSTVKPTT